MILHITIQVGYVLSVSVSQRIQSKSLVEPRHEAEFHYLNKPNKETQETAVAFNVLF